MSKNKLSPSGRGGIDEIRKKWGLEEPNSQPQEGAEGPVSDFLQSVPGNVHDLLSGTNTSRSDDFLDTVFDPPVNTITHSTHLDTSSHLDFTQRPTALNKKELKENISKIDLFIQESLKDNKFLTLTYTRESVATWRGSPLLRFEDKRNGKIYAWNGEIGEKGEILLLIGKTRAKKTTYSEYNTSRNHFLVKILSVNY